MPTMSTWNPNNVNPRCRRIDRAKPRFAPTVRPGNNVRMGKKKKGCIGSMTILGGGFEYIFIFIHTWGRFPIWLIFFRWGLKPPTSYIMMYAIFCLHIFQKMKIKLNVGEYTNHMDPDKVVWVPKKIGGRKNLPGLTRIQCLNFIR